MKKIALVTGASGQDGAYLCEFLLKKKYKVIAADRRSSRDNSWRFKKLNIDHKIIKEDFDLLEFNSILRLFKKYKFNEVYNLGAQSFVKSSFDIPLITSNINGLGVLRIIDIIKNYSRKTKFYQASTSEMYGNANSKEQNENTPFSPRSPYGVSKLFAHHIVKNYRESYNLFACSGILFNHESPLRGDEFVTKKIIKNAIEIKLKKRKYMVLGNLYAKRDWGYSKDYVEAMWLMLQQKKPDDYVISTEKNFSIKEFVIFTFKYLGINIIWRGKGLNEKGINKENNKVIVKISKNYFRPAEVNFLKGSSKKARQILRWKPKTSIHKLVKIMIDVELKNYL
jgi:GDPmannose 4,6-dehydratase